MRQHADVAKSGKRIGLKSRRSFLLMGSSPIVRTCGFESRRGYGIYIGEGVWIR